MIVIDSEWEDIELFTAFLKTDSWSRSFEWGIVKKFTDNNLFSRFKKQQ